MRKFEQQKKKLSIVDIPQIPQRSYEEAGLGECKSPHTHTHTKKVLWKNVTDA